MSQSPSEDVSSITLPTRGSLALPHSHGPLTKRKRAGDDQPAPGKPKKKQKTAKPPKDLEDDGTLDMKQGLNMAIGRMDSSLLADYVAQRMKRFGADLSDIELEDQYIPGSAYANTKGWDKPRNLEHLPAFLNDCSTKFGQKVNKLGLASKTPGAPHTLVISSAGLRAADLTRALRTFQTKDAMVAKLFAKHIKLRESIEMVKKTRIGIGVGTPTRITDLLESRALSSSLLKRVVVDCSYIDQKKRGILDMRETLDPLVRLLNRPEFKDHYGDGQGDVQLIFY